MLFDTNTQVLIQGSTGKEGQRGLAFMRAAGTNIVAGVTPGKGGQVVDDLPIFNTVAEALEQFPKIGASSLFVPPKFVLAAASESILAGIPLLHIFAEGVPTQDTVKLYELSRQMEVRFIGPSSMGIAIPGVGKLGSIGGEHNEAFLAPRPNQPAVAVLSKSGGMANEMASVCTSAGIPQSLVVGLGGDRIAGTTFADLVDELILDANTSAIVCVGEIGGSYEEQFAEKLAETHCTKPVVAFISGMFAETLPVGVSFGHAGAIVSKTEGSRQGKIDALTAVGAHVVTSPEQIVTKLQELLDVSS